MKTSNCLVIKLRAKCSKLREGIFSLVDIKCLCLHRAACSAVTGKHRALNDLSSSSCKLGQTAKCCIWITAFGAYNLQAIKSTRTQYYLTMLHYL